MTAQYLRKKDDPYVFGATDALSLRSDMIPCDAKGNFLYNLFHMPGQGVGLKSEVHEDPAAGMKILAENLAANLGIDPQEAMDLMSQKQEAEPQPLAPAIPAAGLKIEPERGPEFAPEPGLSSEPEALEPIEVSSAMTLEEMENPGLVAYARATFEEKAAHLTVGFDRMFLIEEIERMQAESDMPSSEG